MCNSHSCTQHNQSIIKRSLWNIIRRRKTKLPRKYLRMRDACNHTTRHAQAARPFFKTENLTMYKPSFCCDCGSRIERSRWHLWTTRKFCSDCSPRFRKAQLLLPLIAAITLFLIGLVAGRAIRPAPPPLIVERGELPLATVPSTKSDSKAVETETTENTTSATAPKPGPSYGLDGTATERPTDPGEIITICGARTQKGTPCQRRVRGTGRCWQHRGMPAMIPLEKRIVKSKDEG